MPAYEFTSDWFTNRLITWQDLVLPNLPNTQRRVLELGSYEGRSACWFLDNVIRAGTTDELVCVDHWPGTMIVNEVLFDKNTAGRATKIKQDVKACLPVLAQQKQRFDIIYIDADHDARDTLYAGVLCWEMLNPGGIMIFDDYLWKPEDRFTGITPPGIGIDAFLNTYALELSILHKQYQVFVEKRKNALRTYHWELLNTNK